MNKRVLVVDDDIDILDGIAIVLESEGLTVSTVVKGEETLRKVDEFNPDLILLDIRMSGSDGREICKMLKADSEKRGIPIVMVSADPNVKQSSMTSGADDFLTKPFDTRDLVYIVKKFTAT